MATIQKMTTPPLPTGTFLVWEEMSAESLSLCETLEGKFLFLEPLHIDGAVERYARLISAARLEMEPGPGTGHEIVAILLSGAPLPRHYERDEMLEIFTMQTPGEVA
jgi:hypothetical protein